MGYGRPGWISVKQRPCQEQYSGWWVHDLDRVRPIIRAEGYVHCRHGIPTYSTALANCLTPFSAAEAGTRVPLLAVERWNVGDVDIVVVTETGRCSQEARSFHMVAVGLLVSSFRVDNLVGK